MSQLHSPFNFLAPYSAKDKENFWGRDTEIRELYRMLLATNLVLLYGPSGTGKTSLVQCGLSKKFNGPDWIPLLVRKGENCTRSVQAALGLISALPEGTAVREHLIEIYTRYKRPVYLFFDQFEEIFTLAPKEQGKVILNEESKLTEVQELFAVIRESIDSLPCKFVFILREEFLGQLYAYEPSLPNLFDFRLRVEPMNTAKIDQVLAGTFENFRISCAPPRLSKQIATNLLEGNATSQLAYLQVYLDRLWRTAYHQDQDEKAWTGSPPAVQLTQITLSEVGTVEKVLEVYLEGQEKTIAESIGIEATWVRKLLDSFVTDDGTKRPIVEGSSMLEKRLADPQQLSQCLTKLQEARLILKDNKYYELAHDALAAVLASKRTAAQRLTKEITQILRTSYQLWQNENGGFLNEEYVSIYDRYVTEIEEELEGEVHKMRMIKYVGMSREKNEYKRKELQNKNRELKRTQRDLLLKNATIETSNKKLKWVIGLVVILLLVVSGFSWWGYEIYNTNKNNLANYQHERANQLKLDAKVYAESEDFNDALYKVVQADSLADDPETKQMIFDYRKKINP